MSSSLRRGRRIAAAAATALLGVVALAAPAAQAALSASANDPETGFPFSYTDDSSGLSLALCVDGPPLCINTPRPDPLGPVSVPDNFPPDGEAFWWEAEASMPTGTGGSGLLVLAQEAAFDTTDGTPAAGHQITFGRLRVKASNLVPGATYTITHPYGVDTAQADDLGTIFTTEDVGCLAAPCNFPAAPASRVSSFLQWDPTVAPAPPAGYIGDPAVEHEVIGSPNDTNLFRLEGPNAGGPGVDKVETDLFVVQGQLAGSPPAPAPHPILDTRSVSFPSRQVGAASAPKTVTVTNHGTANDTIGAVAVRGLDAADFKLTADSCSHGALAPGASCSVSVAFDPTATGDRAATLTIPDDSTRSPNAVALSGTGTPGPVPAPIIVVINQVAGGSTGTTPSAGGAGTAGAPTGAVAVKGVSATGSLRLHAQRITTRRTLRIAEARRSGVRVRFVVPAGASIARVELLRGTRRVGAVTVRGAGAKTVRFRRGLRVGRYRVRIRVATGVAALATADTDTRALRIIR